MLYRGDGGPLDLKLKPSLSKSVKATLVAVKPGEEYRLTASLVPPYRGKRVRLSIPIETGVPEHPTVDIRVSGTYRALAVTNPVNVLIPQERTKRWEQIVRLVWDDTKPHNILSASIDHDQVSLDLKEDEAGQHVVLGVPVDFNPTAAAHMLKIYTDDPEMKEVKTRVVLNKRPRAKTNARRTPTNRRPKRAVRPAPTTTRGAPNPSAASSATGEKNPGTTKK